MTVLHRTALDNLGVDLKRAARIGKSGNYGWVILGEEPFRFADPACAARYKAVAEELGLAAIHKRFPVGAD